MEPTGHQSTAETRTGRGSSPEQADETRLATGTRVGRYTILEPAGRGGMGVVYAAYDPTLDRRVALKLLRASAQNRPESSAPRARLLREAQAMARLSHPNVIAVYDVGTFDDEVFVAMEYVPGRKLSTWLKQETPDPGEVVEMFAQAGRGLAAAHASGLIHRDFKPANVMVGDDGRARVLDFGLARAATDQPLSHPGRSEDSEQPVSSLEAPLTEVGTVVGTPFYISPEQYSGHADERSDQYSFCVALYEGLYGQRPFVSESRHELRRLVLHGKTREPPRDSNVPARYLGVIRRGMHVDPAERYPSMNALLADLTRTRRRIWQGLATAAVAITLLAALLYTTVGRRPGLEPCKPATRELAQVWDDSRKQEIERAFTATGLPYAASVWRSVSRELDNYADDWLAMRRDACEATEVRREQSAQLLDLRMLCLRDRLSELRALSDLFASADHKVVEHAVTAAGELRPVSTCGDLRALTERVPPPSDEATRARVATIHEQIAKASALKAAARYQQGIKLATAAAAEARAIGYRPIEAEAMSLLGVIQIRAGDAAAAKETLTDAELAAVAGRDDKVAVVAATQLIFAEGYRLGNHERGEYWARVAMSLLERSGGDKPLEADIEYKLTVLKTVEGKYDEAGEHARRALGLWREVAGDDDPRTAATHHALGVVYKKQGKYQQALEEYQHSLAFFRAALGDDHPDVAMALHNIGVVYKRLGQDTRAEEFLTEALHAWEKTLPENHPNVGMALLNLGMVKLALGKLDQAQADIERAIAVKQALLGPDHWKVAEARMALGDVLQSKKQYRKALAIQREALATLEASLDPDHPELASALRDIGDNLYQQESYCEAAVDYRRAAKIREKALSREGPDLAGDLQRLGMAEVDCGHPEDAVPPLQRAIEILSRHGDEQASQLASSRYHLARALWQSDRDRSEARRLADQAIADYRRAGPRFTKQRAAVRRWLERHPSP